MVSQSHDRTWEESINAEVLVHDSEKFGIKEKLDKGDAYGGVHLVYRRVVLPKKRRHGSRQGRGAVWRGRKSARGCRLMNATYQILQFLSFV